MAWAGDGGAAVAPPAAVLGAALICGAAARLGSFPGRTISRIGCAGRLWGLESAVSARPSTMRCWEALWQD